LALINPEKINKPPTAIREICVMVGNLLRKLDPLTMRTSIPKITQMVVLLKQEGVI
jgi:hypothetical protein